MIRWPQSSSPLSPAARKYLPRFRATVAAAELAADAHTWVLEATSWTEEFPVRLVWRNEHQREVCFTLEEDGDWRIVPCETLPAGANPREPALPSSLRETA